jgi:hypothetical protein
MFIDFSRLYHEMQSVQILMIHIISENNTIFSSDEDISCWILYAEREDWAFPQ